ncbi:unnamed protein product [Ostreobium quekettii]|uniref:Ig-like domain-containing protein n=1 Tax=Ostreobium quekettii TaxID=121088 RepID=A0A8S1IKG7_9CHLO|nr:unnamed protein product [Ostreobium quekettii]
MRMPRTGLDGMGGASASEGCCGAGVLPCGYALAPGTGVSKGPRGPRARRCDYKPLLLCAGIIDERELVALEALELLSRAAARRAGTAAARQAEEAGRRDEPKLQVLLKRLRDVFNPPDGPPQPLQLECLAEEFGVVPRRLLNIVSVLESLQIISRTGRMTYEWRANGDLPSVLETLATDGEKKTGQDSPSCSASLQHPSHQEEVSHWTLSRKYLRLLLTNQKPISTSMAAEYLCNSNGWHADASAKVEEQLKEVVCILTELGLVKKCRRARGCVYKWIGFVDGKSSTAWDKKQESSEPIVAEPPGSRGIAAFRGDREQVQPVRPAPQAFTSGGSGQVVSAPFAYMPIHIMPNMLGSAVVGQPSQAPPSNSMAQTFQSTPTFGRVEYMNVLPVSSTIKAPSVHGASTPSHAVGVPTYIHSAHPTYCVQVGQRDSSGAVSTTGQPLPGASAAMNPGLFVHAVQQAVPQSCDDKTQGWANGRSRMVVMPPASAGSAAPLGVPQRGFGWAVAAFDRRNGMPTGHEASSRFPEAASAAAVPRGAMEAGPGSPAAKTTLKQGVLEGQYGGGGSAVVVMPTGPPATKVSRQPSKRQDTRGAVPAHALVLPPSSADYATLMALLAKGQNGEAGLAFNIQDASIDVVSGQRAETAMGPR